MIRQKFYPCDTCECGCGQVVKPRRRFVHGHNRVGQPGNGRPRTRTTYFERGRRREHVIIAERALGKPLPAGAHVHHVDGDKHNNDPRNLVVCQDVAYHRHLHTRQRAKASCGNADWWQCVYCRKWDAPEAMATVGTRPSVHYHRTCGNADRAKRGRS